MPKGEPLKRTIRNANWNKKAGYKTKSFSLRGDIHERFAAACEKVGRSQASVVQEFMEGFIREVDGRHDENTIL